MHILLMSFVSDDAAVNLELTMLSHETLMALTAPIDAATSDTQR